MNTWGAQLPILTHPIVQLSHCALSNGPKTMKENGIMDNKQKRGSPSSTEKLQLHTPLSLFAICILTSHRIPPTRFTQGVGSRQGVFCVDRQGQSERGRSQPAAFGEQSAHLGVVGLDVAVEGGEVSPRVVAERDGEEQTLLLCAGGQIPARIPHHASRRAWEDTTSAVTSHWPCGHWQ